MDVYGRTFKTLRISLTESCNFACAYCVSSDNELNTSVNRKPEFDILKSLKLLHKVLELDAVRLTGGEPTLYKKLPELIRELSVLHIPLKLTTNGFLLAQQADLLSDAGLKSINVSLDALNEETFYKVTRRKALAQVLDGIDKARAAGIEVKINSVIMKGINEDQVLPLFEFGLERNITVRYLELMRMGHLFSHGFEKHFFSRQEILDVITKKYIITDLYREPSATTNYWQTTDGYRFGIIANETSPFCNDCDRLRLDSKGNIYGCLSNNQSIAVNWDNEQSILEKLKLALNQKQYSGFTGSNIPMIGIGG